METTIINMNPVMVLLLMTALVAAIGAGIWALKNGMLTTEMMATGTAMLEGVECAAQALARATGNPAVAVASFIFKAAGEAAHAAEQMYKTGAIGSEERNAKAKEIAEDLLRLAGIAVTEDRKAAIAVLLEAECDIMGHALEEIVTAEQEIELDAQPEIKEGIELHEAQLHEEEIPDVE